MLYDSADMDEEVFQFQVTWEVCCKGSANDNVDCYVCNL